MNNKRVLFFIVIFSALVFYISDRNLTYYFNNFLNHKVFPVDIKLKPYVPNIESLDNKHHSKQKYYIIYDAFGFGVPFNCSNSNNSYTDFKFMEYCINSEQLVIDAKTNESDRFYLLIKSKENKNVESECVTSFNSNSYKCYKVKQFNDLKLSVKIILLRIVRIISLLSFIYFFLTLCERH